ncbi:predicted protein, partial [Nematostella vectensis]
MKTKHRIIILVLVGISFIFSLLHITRPRKKNSIDRTYVYGRYSNPWNNTIKGIEFLFDQRTLDLLRQLVIEMENGVKVRAVTPDVFNRHIKPVTAISSNHFEECMAHLHRVSLFFPNVDIIVYDLGMKPAEVRRMQYLPFVEYRRLNFSRYPSFVADLHLYAWKALVIQGVLAEFGSALWFDASIVFNHDYGKILDHVVAKNSSFLFYIRKANHNILSATQPQTFKYLPMKTINHLTNSMPQSGGMLIFNTEIVRRDIMQWALACSLLQDCIAPIGSTINGCGDKYPVLAFSGCHRFDQSVFAITVANAYDSEVERYSLPDSLLSFAHPWRTCAKTMVLIMKKLG